MRDQSLVDAEERLELESSSPGLGLRAAKDMPPKQWKAVLRSHSVALRDPLRDDLWRELALRHSCGARPPTPDDALSTALETRKLPKFVEPRVARFFRLNPAGRQDVTRVLWSLSQSCPHVTFAPLVYPLTALFLHFHDVIDVYKCMYSLINSRDVHFMATTRAEKSRDAIILVKLTKKLGILRPRKVGADAREKLRNNALDTAFGEYLQWIFSLPFHHVVRVVDCFLVEGEKFLFRVALTLALLCHKTKGDGLSLDKMRDFCESIADVISPNKLIATALKVTRLSRKDIARAKSKAELRSESVSFCESPLHAKYDVIDTKDYIVGARIAPLHFRSSILSTWSLLDALWEWLPERLVVREPVVVFCSAENGNSLQTFFTLCADFEPTLLLIKTIQNEIFGAFCSTSWSKRLDLSQTKSGQYFGTGETFLFVLAPKVTKYEWIGRQRAIDSHSQQLFMSATARSLCVGSGGGAFGLFIDESLTRGQSAKCDTFANDPLSQDSTNFDISVLEVIAFS
ncbi:unnamed protein product [Oppiella nova]|uniref:TLDc domain-containing protein n=1 Tax=Oppiella nova TaxID=334625 RepID=A0A7R9LW12_9ACAR|nr:unnamed protein product [Oppiella nova]CAG2167456.1 unnamed protein product [Oppiella nova]